MARKRESNVALAWTLRVFAVLHAVTAAGFVAYGCIVQYPPKAALPLGLVVLGCIGLVIALLGFIGSFYQRCCLAPYLVLAALMTVAELGITLSMFFALDQAVTEVVKSMGVKGLKKAQEEKHVREQITGGRWFFLVMVLLQAIGLLVAVVIRVCVVPRQQSYEDFEAGQRDAAANAGAQQQIQLENLKSSIQRSASKRGGPEPGGQYASNSKLYRNVTQRMASKYGDYTTDSSFQKSWWQRTFG